MKDLIVSICAVAVLIGGWLIFAHASQAQIDDLNGRIREEIIPAVESAQWDEAYKKVQVLSLCFRRYSEKLAARYFYKETKVRITKSEISMRTWRSPMSAASQGAFAAIPEISLCNIPI